MYNFELKIPTEIYFGVNVEEQVGKLMKPYSSKVMLVYGSERIFKNGLGEKIVGYLESEGCEVVKQGGVKPNADEEYIEKAIKLAREEGVDGIVAIGGGSVIDSAKAISAGMFTEGNIMDIYKGKATPVKFLPIGAIVTVPATASESNGMSVISSSKTKEKIGGFFEETKPKFALLNPELTLTVSRYQTAAGGFDIFAHAFERYIDLTRHSLLLDEMTMGVMKTMIEILPDLIDNPLDMEKRSDMMFAATVAHNDMIGPGGDFACHQISHEITESYGIAHGGALAMIIPAWCEYMKDRQRDRLTKLFAGLFGSGSVEEGITALKSFISSIGLSLGVNVDCDETEYIANKIVGDLGFTGGACEKLDKADVISVLKKFMSVGA